MSIPSYTPITEEPAKLETESMRLDEKRLQNLASGTEQVQFSGDKAKLAAALQKLASLGLSAGGLSGLLNISSDGMLSGELAAISDIVNKADSTVESEILAAEAGKILATAINPEISGGENISGASFFSSLNHGLNPDTSQGKQAQKIPGGISIRN